MSEKTYPSYPSLYTLGHAHLRDLFTDGAEVTIEEKVDGSQFSFGVVDGVLQCRSKRCILSDPIPDLFRGAVTTAKTLFDEGKLVEGWVYRGEAIQRPKHNTLCYDRTPNYFIAIYDVMTGLEDYAPYQFKKEVCDGLGLECVPLLYQGPVDDPSKLKDLLDRTSFLGGAKIEGIVIKNHARFGYDKKPLIAKLVADSFKEIHQGDWKDRHPKNGDIILNLVEKYRTPARWAKAMQHLRDDGTLTNSPKDIGPIIVECQADIRKECEDMIKDELFAWAWKQIAHKLVGGLPQWYKEQLVESPSAEDAA
jgi:hypothetical protein